MTKFSELPPAEQYKFLTIAGLALDGTILCNRAWIAWRHGTMKESDFSNTVDDEAFVLKKAELIYNEFEAENARLREALKDAESWMRTEITTKGKDPMDCNQYRFVLKALEQ